MYFERGSQMELERWLRLFVLTEPDIEQHDAAEIRLYAATETDAPYLEEDGCYSTPRLQALVELALEENYPVGWAYEYNDGPVARASDYHLAPEALCWYIHELLGMAGTAAARERMAARRSVRQYVAQRQAAGPALAACLLEEA